MNIKNEDGTYNHFQMKGGPFAGWLRDINKLANLTDAAEETFKKLHDSDIDGTGVAISVFNSISQKLEKLYSAMEAYREVKINE